MEGELERWVAEGRSIREIADRLGVSYSTARSRIAAAGLQTIRARRLRDTSGVAPDAEVVRSICAEHGEVELVRRDGGWRCKRCRVDAVLKRRRAIKAQLVAEAGGACLICGYDRSVWSLHFHHLDPSSKAFSIAGAGMTRSLEAARAEARKCVLLCANCHGEVEAGETRLPSPSADPG